MKNVSLLTSSALFVDLVDPTLVRMRMQVDKLLKRFMQILTEAGIICVVIYYSWSFFN